MNTPNELFQDYARRPVPEERQVKGWHIVVIYVGVALTLPAYLTGGQVGINVGLTGGIVATVIAALVLAGVGAVTGYVGARTRLSTYMISRSTFGRTGAKVTNFVIALSFFGWFGVTAAFFAEATNALAADFMGLEWGVATWIFIGTVLMISTALFGFKGLDALSKVVTPLLFILLMAAVVRSLGQMSFASAAAYENPEGFPVGAAVSMFIGAWMVGAVALPDLSRYAITPRHGLLGGGASFIVGMVVVIIPCVFLAIANGEPDIVRIVVSFGWAAWALLIVVLSAWSSNDNNIYSASLSLASLFERVEKWKITIAAGVAGGLLAAVGIMDQLVPFLLGLGILIPPVAGIFATDFFVRPKAYTSDGRDTAPAFRWQAFAAWIAASAVAYATQPAAVGGLGLFSITMVPAVDALLVSALGYYALYRLTATAEPEPEVHG